MTQVMVITTGSDRLQTDHRLESSPTGVWPTETLVAKCRLVMIVP